MKVFAEKKRKERFIHQKMFKEIFIIELIRFAPQKKEFKTGNKISFNHFTTNI